jgi:hypothetical protein
MICYEAFDKEETTLQGDKRYCPPCYNWALARIQACIERVYGSSSLIVRRRTEKSLYQPKEPKPNKPREFTEKEMLKLKKLYAAAGAGNPN